jgi:ectoine hydroxylase-related dioxygenase (phytanoyl-CoA dioxygenase family)
MVATDLDFNRFHLDDLPERLAAGNGALAVADARLVGSLAIRTPAGAYTYLPTDETIAVVPGDDDAKTVVALDDATWRALASDLDTPPAMFYGGRIDVVRGNPLRFIRWEPALRAMYHGRPVYDAATIDLHGFDPATTFTMDDVANQPAVMRDFLESVGYLVLKNVFTADEVAGFCEDAEILKGEAVEGDQMSWWGKDADGNTVLCRTLRAGTRPRIGGLHDDARVQSLVALSPHGLESRRLNGKVGATVLWKTPHVAEGLADLPWHRDCGMGGHAMNCPTMVMTICLTDGSEGAGELRALPGSQHTTHPFVDGNDEKAPRGVSLTTKAGDLSLHYSDVMHASMPPTSDEGPHRVSILLGFARPDAGNHRGERHYNDVLLGREDGQVEHHVDHVQKRH